MADVVCGKMAVEGDAWFSTYATARRAVAKKAVLLIHHQGGDIEVPQSVLKALGQQHKGNTKAPAGQQRAREGGGDPSQSGFPSQSAVASQAGLPPQSGHPHSANDRLYQPENANPFGPNQANAGNIPMNNQDLFTKIKGKKGS
jgi:hypothetical protein